MRAATPQRHSPSSKVTGFSVVRRQSVPSGGPFYRTHFGFFCCPPTVRPKVRHAFRILGASRTEEMTPFIHTWQICASLLQRWFIIQSDMPLRDQKELTFAAYIFCREHGRNSIAPSQDDGPKAGIEACCWFPCSIYCDLPFSGHEAIEMFFCCTAVISGISRPPLSWFWQILGRQSQRSLDGKPGCGFGVNKMIRRSHPFGTPVFRPCQVSGWEKSNSSITFPSELTSFPVDRNLESLSHPHIPYR